MCAPDETPYPNHELKRECFVLESLLWRRPLEVLARELPPEALAPPHFDPVHRHLPCEERRRHHQQQPAHRERGLKGRLAGQW